MRIGGDIVAELRALAAREVVGGRNLRIGLALATFVTATALGAYVAVPLPWTPVPMTLQPLFVLLAGALLGARWGAAAMGAYVVLGALGAPVFSAGRGGILHLLGPTGGYLAAFPAAAWVVGRLAGGSGAGLLRLAGALLAGLGALYAGGLAQLAVLTGAGPRELLALGVVPFLAGDLVKVGLALVLTGRLRRRTLGLL